MLGLDASDGDDVANGCTARCQEHLFSLRDSGRTDVLLVGCETHVCVQQTALDMLASGFRVMVAADAVSSARPTDRSAGIATMRQAGVTVSTSESLVFRMLGGSKHPQFKAVGAVMKPVRDSGDLGHEDLSAL